MKKTVGRKSVNKIDKSNKIKLIVLLIFSIILLILLSLRILYIQFFETRDGVSLKTLASRQQTSTRSVPADRGIIYDSNGKVLAISANVDTVSINPEKIKYSDDSEVDKDFLAKSFSDMFNLNYEELLEKLNTESTFITIASKVETDKIASLKEWMKSNKIYSGINIDSTIRRYYPYSTLASNLIGFTGTDNSGLWGLESSLNSILAGTDGKIVTLIDSVNSEIPNQEQTYIDAINGSNVYLTIDVNIQSSAEKYLSQAVEDNNADSGVAIAMNPTTGEVVAMASYPNYDLNSPFTPTNSNLLKNWDALSSEAKTEIRYNMWKNLGVETTYEPGSTFKIITAATALEEGLVSTDHAGDFYCSGYQTLDNGVKIRCWSPTPHGSQSLRDALANSCNPAFMQLGAKIGAQTLYKYYNAFGLFDKTNSYFYGEQNSIFFDINNVHSTELATISFGQRFNITPMQLVAAVSAVANEGILVQPKIVKAIENTNTGAIESIPTTEIRQVISKETASSMMDMLEYVVTDGTGGYAKVSGYTVGGKTGTSEPLSGNDKSGYVASFIGIAPTNNAKLVVLVALFNPKNGQYHGGTIAAPVVSQILSDALPYLGVTPDNISINTSSASFTTKTLPDVKNRTLQDAKNTLKNLGFTVHTVGTDNLDSLVTVQTPKPGTALLSNADVYLYTDDSTEKTMVTVPNFKGMSASEAINSAKAKNLNLSLNGSGIVTSQDIASGLEVEVGSVINVTLQSQINGGY